MENSDKKRLLKILPGGMNDRIVLICLRLDSVEKSPL